MVARDRGQVLLLGGLAIAIVFLTAIPLSNSLVVSESASSSGTVSDIDRTADREASVERSLRTLMADTNTSDRDAINESLSEFSRHYTNVSGRQDGVHVNASVNLAASARSLSGESFTTPGGPRGQPWSPVEDSTGITTFTTTFSDAPNSAPNPFVITISNDSGEQYRLEAWVNNPDTLVVRTDNGTGSTSRCETTQPTNITVDILAGTCDRSGVAAAPVTGSADSFSPGSGEYDVRFAVTGGQAEGRFTLASVGDFYDIPDDSDDAYELGIGRPAVDVTYVGPDTSYTRTILVDETS